MPALRNNNHQEKKKSMPNNWVRTAVIELSARILQLVGKGANNILSDTAQRTHAICSQLAQEDTGLRCPRFPLRCPRFPFMRAAYLRFCAHFVHFLAPMIHIFSRRNVFCPRFPFMLRICVSVISSRLSQQISGHVGDIVTSSNT